MKSNDFSKDKYVLIYQYNKYLLNSFFRILIMGTTVSGLMNSVLRLKNVFDITLYGLDNSGKTVFKHLVANLNDPYDNNQYDRQYKPQ